MNEDVKVLDLLDVLGDGAERLDDGKTLVKTFVEGWPRPSTGLITRLTRTYLISRHKNGIENTIMRDKITCIEPCFYQSLRMGWFE